MAEVFWNLLLIGYIKSKTKDFTEDEWDQEQSLVI